MNKSATPWFDRYTGKAPLVFDDFYGWAPFDFMLRLMDKFPMTVETKGSTLDIAPVLIVITSNMPAEQLYKHINNDLFPAFLRRIEFLQFTTSFEDCDRLYNNSLDSLREKIDFIKNRFEI